MGPLVETKSRTCAATFCPLHQTSFNMAEEDLRPVEVKLFGKWSYEEIEVKDISLEDYIAVKTKSAVFVPHTAGRYQKKRFRKAQCPIIERLTCSLMMHGQQRQEAHGCPHLSHAFEIIHLLTDQNPLQVAVDAIINSGPREAAFRNVKTIAECLADELINAAKGSSNSYAIKKKDEIERVAKANR